MILAIMALFAQAATPPDPDLGWMAGYWLSCASAVETSETWSAPRASLMLGTTIRVAGEVSWEQARIERREGRLVFFASPSGQPPAEFPLRLHGRQEVVFENPAHDFPQRLIYRREGDRLIARIEGERAGRTRSAQWTYRAAPLNSRCPDPVRARLPDAGWERP